MMKARVAPSAVLQKNRVQKGSKLLLRCNCGRIPLLPPVRVVAAVLDVVVIAGHVHVHVMSKVYSALLLRVVEDHSGNGA